MTYILSLSRSTLNHLVPIPVTTFRPPLATKQRTSSIQCHYTLKRFYRTKSTPTINTSIGTETSIASSSTTSTSNDASKNVVTPVPLKLGLAVAKMSEELGIKPDALNGGGRGRWYPPKVFYTGLEAEEIIARAPSDMWPEDVKRDFMGRGIFARCWYKGAWSPCNRVRILDRVDARGRLVREHCGHYDSVSGKQCHGLFRPVETAQPTSTSTSTSTSRSTSTSTHQTSPSHPNIHTWQDPTSDHVLYQRRAGYHRWTVSNSAAQCVETGRSARNKIKPHPKLLQQAKEVIKAQNIETDTPSITPILIPKYQSREVAWGMAPEYEPLGTNPDSLGGGRKGKWYPPKVFYTGSAALSMVARAPADMWPQDAKRDFMGEGIFARCWHRGAWSPCNRVRLLQRVDARGRLVREHCSYYHSGKQCHGLFRPVETTKSPTGPMFVPRPTPASKPTPKRKPLRSDGPITDAWEDVTSDYVSFQPREGYRRWTVSHSASQCVETGRAIKTKLAPQPEQSQRSDQAMKQYINTHINNTATNT